LYSDISSSALGIGMLFQIWISSFRYGNNLIHLLSERVINSNFKQMHSCRHTNTPSNSCVSRNTHPTCQSICLTSEIGIKVTHCVITACFIFRLLTTEQNWRKIQGLEMWHSPMSGNNCNRWELCSQRTKQPIICMEYLQRRISKYTCLPVISLETEDWHAIRSNIQIYWRTVMRVIRMSVIWPETDCKKLRLIVH
jgi:hypothetical protein